MRYENGKIIDPSIVSSEIVPAKLVVQQQWQKSVTVPFEEAQGDHGGSDDKLLKDLFEGVSSDPLERAASHVDGAKSILVGVAANQAFEAQQPVRIRDLINPEEWTNHHDLAITR